MRLLLSQYVILFDYLVKKMISDFSTPKSSVTSYNPLIFYLIGAICQSFFIKTLILILQSNFFLCFRGNPLHKSKNSDSECCPNNEFFSMELIQTTREIKGEEMLLNSCYFAINQFKLKRETCLKFYHLLILLPGEISLNPGLIQCLPENDCKFEPLLYAVSISFI